MTCANSPTLARVHGQWGCASINRVALSVCRGTKEADGQFDEIKPTSPGVVSYLNRTRAPNARAAIQITPSKAVMKIFLREEITIVSEALAVIKHPPFHSGRRLRIVRRVQISQAKTDPTKIARNGALSQTRLRLAHALERKPTGRRRIHFTLR